MLLPFLHTANVSLVTEVSFRDFDAPGWFDVDITTHLNKVLTGTNHVMSLKFDGSASEANKGKHIRIAAKEGANPSHLLIYLDESIVPPPAEPTGLVATPGYGHVTLEWEPNTESDLASYNVYRKVGSDGFKLEAMGLTTVTYTDYVNVKAGKPYTYQVTAVDIAGTESTRSESISTSSCRTLDCGEVPPKPTYPIPDGWCQGGTSNGEFCCGECGGKCGGSDCNEFPGGSDECCMSALERICSDKQDTACIIPSTDPGDSDGDVPNATDTGDEPGDDFKSGYPGPDPAGWCKDGIFLENFCCGECDGQCGGFECELRAGGGSECCTSQFDRVCEDKNDVACLIPEFDPDATETLTDKPSPAPTKKPTHDVVSDLCSVHTIDKACKNDYNCFWDNGVCSDDCPDSWLEVKCIWEKRRNGWRWRSVPRPAGGGH